MSLEARRDHYSQHHGAIITGSMARALLAASCVPYGRRTADLYYMRKYAQARDPSCPPILVHGNVRILILKTSGSAAKIISAFAGNDSFAYKQECWLHLPN